MFLDSSDSISSSSDDSDIEYEKSSTKKMSLAKKGQVKPSNPASVKKFAVTVACHVILASGRLVDVDIPELSESPWPGSDIF